MRRVWVGIDGGGTTFKIILLDDARTILHRTRIATTSPGETLNLCVDFIRSKLEETDSLSAVGVAMFGPLNLDKDNSAYGAVLKTAKPGWEGANVRQVLQDALGVPVFIDTDVNGALLAEQRWGNAKHKRDAAYMTVGTGIGVGLSIRGDVAGRPSHPEFGHIAVKRHPADLDFKGICPFHGDCLEGLASAKALTARFGDPTKLPPDHIGWEIVADYLAQACYALYLATRLDVIVLGGGLMQAPHLLSMVRQAVVAMDNSYLGLIEPAVEALIQPAGLGDDAGAWGGAALALTHD
ncbi:MAG: ROK family protein [Henriciella sp.]|nr:ROK family protein [Henriciella sp.]